MLELISADPSAQDLFLPCFGIENPGIAFLDDGYRKRVIFFPDVKNDFFVTLAHQFTCLFIGLHKPFSNLFISHLVAGKDNLFPRRTEDEPEAPLYPWPLRIQSGFLPPRQET